MDDLIVIILTLLIMGIGAFTQAKKRKMPVPMPQEKKPEPDFWQTLFDEQEEVEQEPIPQEGEMITATLKSTGEQESRNYSFGNSIEGQSYLFKKDPFYNEKLIDSEENSNMPSEVVKDFSLRKAVLFSEILKTKYF